MNTTNNEMTSNETFFKCPGPRQPDRFGCYWRTEMTGPQLREASVRNNQNETIRIKHGQRVCKSITCQATDGDDLRGMFSGTITAMARGIENGMHGNQTLIVEITLDGDGVTYAWPKPITKLLIPARFLESRELR